MSEISTRTYELGFLITPTTPEMEVAAQIDALKAEIVKVGGEVLSLGGPEFIDLAYQMERTIGSKHLKYNQAYFGWMKFTAEPDTLVALKKAYDANLEVIRYMLIKTTVENTVVFKKPKVEPKRDTVAALEDDILEDDVAVDDVDLKEDHELLPDVLADITEAPAPTEKEEI